MADELLYPDRETRVARRDGERRVARLARLSGLSGGGPVGDRVRGDRSYLVTGGFGGIGLRVAGWLAERGAGAIVLNRRRAVDAEAEGALASLRERGAEVRAEIGDVTDGETVEALLSRVDRELPPLGGVIHSVGVLSDGAVENLDWGRFEKVLWPKVLGAWRLHRATLDRDLDLFVLFSSVAGVLGNPGQANYAAANAFLDQLARHRRGLGLPGQAIAWGGWSESGMAEAGRERMGDRMGEAGVGWLRPEQGLEALMRLVGADVGASVAVAADWSRLPFRPPLLEEVAGVDDGESPAVSGALVERLRGVPGSEREEAVIGFLQEEVASVLRLRSIPATDAGFFDLGMDSLMAVEFRNRLNQALGGALTLSNTAVFDYPDTKRLARYLATELEDVTLPERESALAEVVSAPTAPVREQAGERVAIVGMACRFPGGEDVRGFWEMLRSGGFAVTRGRPDGLMVAGEEEDEAPWGAYVPDLDRFDAEFFGIAPVEAELMDPQQRLLLETSWEALEDAGFDPGRLRGSRTGVYAGIMNRDYERLAPLAGAEGGRGAYLATGMGNAAAVGRVSFVLGLMGPAIAVDTACSSALVAIHQAAVAIRQGEADLALAGGVNVILSAALSNLALTAGMLSPRGRCSTFDAAADGYVRGEGCGMVVLKRLSEAERDGDRILGVLLGSAVNQDGASAGFTVPNGPAQETVIREALERAGVPASSVDYLEAHGTGTELGDPIEVQAAAAVYGESREAERPLLLGSVKTNVGHLESAAGVAGVVKALLAMRHDLIPPHLHFERPNPRIPWDDLPVRVTSEETPWPEAAERPRRAAVSSFGYSGTNAHLILEEYAEEDRQSSRWGPSGRHRPPPADETPYAPRTHRVLPLSGKTPQALRDLAARYQAWLTKESPLADTAWTAGVGRSHFAHRAGVTFRDLDSLRERLELVERGADRRPAPGAQVAFLYPGEGSERPGMGRDLYEREPAFREVVDRCEAVVREVRERSLLSVLFGEQEGLDRTEWAQPALYALESGLTALWAGAGVRPQAVIGHGAGEVAAARAAGVFDLEAGLRFALRRGELLGALPAGGALAGPVLDELESAVGEVSAPSVPLVGGVSGRVLESAPDGAYWRRQAREAVRFGPGVRTLSELGVGVLIEVGPRGVLGPLALEAWSGEEEPVAVSTLGRDGNGDFATAVGSVWEAGLEVAFGGLFAGEERRRVALPTYPFQRERYWVEAPRRRRLAEGHPLLGVRRDGPDGETSFEAELSRVDPGWLGDYRVFGEAVAPAALYAAQAVAAAGETGRGGGVSLEDVQVHRPLTLASDGGRTVQVVVGAEDDWRVFSREGGGRSWELHAEGRVTAAVGEGEAKDLGALREGLLLLDAGAFYGRVAEVGIGYGPSFRVLEGLWSGEAEALGELALPAGLAGEGLGAHPALLDGCFQVLSGVLELVAEGGLWLPVGWDRLWVSGPLPGRLVCHVRLRPVAGETRKADLGLYAPGGAPVGGVEGFALKRASRSALLGAEVEDLLYEVAWREGPAVGVRSAAFLAGPDALVSGARPLSEVAGEEGADEAGLAAEADALERESRWFVLRALAELGWERRAGERFEAEELRRGLQVTGDYAGLFGRLLGLLDDAGVVARDPGGGWLVTAGSEDPLPEDVSGPEGAADSVERAVLRRCGASLSEVLRGRKDPRELLIGEEPEAADIYRHSVAERTLNRLVGEAAGNAVSGLPEGRRLAVLEVGAGTGTTASAVLGALPVERTRYEYTDRSAEVVGAAAPRFEALGLDVRCRVLDIERDPLEQGFAGHGFDVVIAANVLHATRNLGEALAHCRKLLAPSGLLLAVEGTEPQGWLDLTFGLAPWWWRFEDGVRGDYPLVGREVWRRALSDAGYGEVGFLGGVRGQTVIVARGPGDLESEAGLFVLSGGGDLGEALSRELEGRGQTVLPGPGEGEREDWRSFFGSLPEGVPLRGVAHLAGVREDEAGLGPEELAGAVASVGRSGLSLVQGMTDAGVRPDSGLWFVTRGGQVVEGETGGSLSGAQLWGFGAVLGVEHGELGARLVDLDPERAPGEGRSVAELADELLYPDRETRVARRDGERRVARLARLSGLSGGGPVGDRVRGDRSYLVTGGFGGIGLRVAGWLAERGAGAIVLNRRRAVDAEAEGALASLRERGAEVRAEIGDVTDGETVEALLSRVDRELPPLGGVIHSVGVLSDGAVENLDWGRFEKVLWPKVLGAWRLHRATLDRDLDLFVLFSSVAGVLGNPGQANYAAANAFLDQLARHRRGLGLPGQAIAWGGWSESGMAEAGRERMGDRMGEAGVGWLRPEQGLEALMRLVGADVGASVAVAADWSRLPFRPPLLEEVAGVDDGESPAVSGALVERLRGVPGSEREEAVIGFLQEEVASVLRLRSIPATDAGFFDLGMDSLMAVEFRNRLNQALGGALTLSNTAVFDYPNIARLAKYLVGELPGAALPTAAPRVRTPPPVEGGAIALIGMAGRFPGAADVTAFARGLAEGLDGIRPHRPGGLPGRPEGEMEPAPAGYLEGIDRFDADFFGIPAGQAKFMEPQQRLLLEMSWHALEDAGIQPGSLDGSRTGVYAALGLADREFGNVTGFGGAAPVGMHGFAGSSAATAVGRIAYLLRLEGPAISVDTTCSSSLVAVHQAILDLERGDTDLALAGGANVILSERSTRAMVRSGLLSARGRCSAFDAAADGYVRGEGCGMVVLKRLAEAEAAGDRILAVIRGSAVNQDGARAALSAPAGPGQRRVMESALGRARLDPSEVDYLEAHGVGSALGDPIEVNAVAAVYGRNRPPTRPLLLGSVKTNIGHLEAAAGVVALIKAVLAIRAREIPPQLHFQRPNPAVAWDAAPLRVASEPACWPEDPGRVRRAAVSAFGLSGTNAHLLIEEHGASTGHLEEVSGAPRAVPVATPDGVEAFASAERVSAERPRRLLPLSARSPVALRSLAKRYLDLLDGAGSRSAPLDLADLAWTAGVGRQPLEHRAGLVFEGTADLRPQLEELAGRPSGPPPRPPKRVAFLFPGERESWSFRERTLFETEPVARAVLDRCDAVLAEVGAPPGLRGAVHRARRVPSGGGGRGLRRALRAAGRARGALVEPGRLARGRLRHRSRCALGGIRGGRVRVG